MMVYGHICDYTEKTDAVRNCMNMQAGQERPTGWLGFYQERGENVTAIGYHYEARLYLDCGWVWVCRQMPKRPPRYPEPWEHCGWAWLCEWKRKTMRIADTFAYSGRSLLMMMVNNHSCSSPDLGSFNILECTSYPPAGRWFSLCKYWGCAKRIGDNAYKI